MKFVINFFLILIFVPLFLATTLSWNIKYQILDYSFWQNNLNSNNVYSNLAQSVNKVSQLKLAGGAKDDGSMKVFAKLATPENLKDLIENNLKNFLKFANGQSNEWLVYVPVSKLPKSLTSFNGVKLTENTSIQTLAKDLKIQGFQEKQIQNINKSGKNATAAFVYGATFLFILLLVSLLLVESGGRFISTGLMVTLSGVLLYIVSGFFKAIQGSMVNDWPNSKEPIQILLSPIAPHLISAIAKSWVNISVTVIILGILFMFLKKPQIKV